MSDEEENDSDKTQIFLPGGELPKRPKAADEDNKGVLLKATTPTAASSKESTTVDFDITSGAGLGGEAGTGNSGDEARERAAAAAAAARAQQQVAANSASSGSSFGTIIVVLIVAAIAYFLLR